ncbi:MAG: ATP-binding cassette domain-containing protein [Fimbriimonadales bacterium]
MIEAVDLSAGYEGREVLRSLNFRAKPGEIVALLGPNGSGKSTLIRCLCGILSPTEGSVRIDGDNIRDLSQKEIAKQISVVPQTEDSVFEFTVYDVVAMGRFPWDDFDNGHIKWALENSGCQALVERRVTELSGGERQRVLFARALAQGGHVLLLDEPTAHMDVGYQIATLSLARELARQNHTVVVALHDLNLASGFADRAVLLHDGRVAIEGPVETVLQSDEIERVYGASFDRLSDARTGRTILVPEIIPDRSRARKPLRIHFIGGGGSAGALMAEAWQLGHKVSLGVTLENDSDTEAARRLGAEFVVADQRVEQADVRLALEMARQSDLVVVCASPYSAVNLPNLALAYMAREAGARVWLVEPHGLWDFTGGEAERAVEALLRADAESLSETEIRQRLTE